MLELIEGLPRLFRQSIEPHPNQKDTADVIALNSGFTALTGF